MSSLNLPTNALIALFAQKQAARDKIAEKFGEGLMGGIKSGQERAETEKNASALETLLNIGKSPKKTLQMPALEGAVGTIPIQNDLKNPSLRPPAVSYTSAPELPKQQMPMENKEIDNPEYVRMPRDKKVVESVYPLLAKKLLGLDKSERDYTAHLTMPSKQSETGYGHFGYDDKTDNYSKYIGPAPAPYGSADQPGMGQFVGPLEDNPQKGTIFVPKRGGGETKTIDLPGRTSKKTLDTMSANTKATLGSARVAYKGINEAEKLYNEALKGVTGPIEGRAQLAYAKIANSPKIAELQQKLGRTLASVLRAESGLVVTDTERKFYEDNLLPMLKNPQANFETLLRETKKWIQDIHDSNIDILRETNTESPNKLSEMKTEQRSAAQPNSGTGVVWRRNAQGKLERVSQ